MAITDLASLRAHKPELIDAIIENLAASLEPLTPSDSKERFEMLMQEWQCDTKFLSNIDEIALHPAYQRIIGMGPTVIPFILEKLITSPGYWFWALKAITGEDPVPAADRGDMVSMTQHWLQWGRENGYGAD
ncbi:MAG: hypothetical protein ACOYOE_03545 [Chlorobium sp.]